MSRRWSLCVCVVFLLSAHPAAAQHAPHIDYDAPDGCPTGDALRAAVERSLRDVIAPLPSIQSVVQITREGAAFRAALRLLEQDSTSERDVRDASCAVLVDAIVLIIAVALAPGLELDAISEVRPEPQSDGPNVVAEVDPSATQVPSEPGPSLRGALRISAHGSYGTLPGVALGAELGGSVLWDALRLDAALRGLPLVGARFGASSDSGADLALVVGLVRAMGVVIVDPHVELTIGGGVEAGAALGRAVGISVPRDTAAPWLALEAALGLSWVPIPEFALTLELEGLIPIVRPVFTVDGLGVLYRPEPAAGALRISVEARFG